VNVRCKNLEEKFVAPAAVLPKASIAIWLGHERPDLGPYFGKPFGQFCTRSVLWYVAAGGVRSYVGHCSLLNVLSENKSAARPGQRVPRRTYAAADFMLGSVGRGLMT
jgi:hypothetical protein